MAFNDTIVASYAYASASNLSLLPYSDNSPFIIESSGLGEKLLTTVTSTLVTLLQTTKNLTIPPTHLIRDQTTSYPFVFNSSSLLSTVFSSVPLTSTAFHTSLSSTTTSTTTTVTTTTTFIRFSPSSSVSYLPVGSATPSTTLRYKPVTSSSTYIPAENDYFLFKTNFHRIIRIVELFILSLTLPLYAIVLILFIEINIQHHRRKRMRSLMWTSNYLLVDFIGLLYEIVYVIIHLTGDLKIKSTFGLIYCQFQLYIPLYLTATMAYSLMAISIYRRRHFIRLDGQTRHSKRISFIMIACLWLIPLITSIIPASILTRFNIMKMFYHEHTNECQINYSYSSGVEAAYMFYRLGHIFLLPLTVSFICYLTIFLNLIQMQKRFDREFKRHVHIRKNLILQILFLFLNFAVFWLPAEIITIMSKNRILKDTVQVTKSLNILLDPIIITGFDTRFSNAAKQLLKKWRLYQLLCARRSLSEPSAQGTITSTRGGGHLYRTNAKRRLATVNTDIIEFRKTNSLFRKATLDRNKRKPNTIALEEFTQNQPNHHPLILPSTHYRSNSITTKDVQKQQQPNRIKTNIQHHQRSRSYYQENSSPISPHKRKRTITVPPGQLSANSLSTRHRRSTKYSLETDQNKNKQKLFIKSQDNNIDNITTL